jgi:hypothetical protein
MFLLHLLHRVVAVVVIGFSNMVGGKNVFNTR